jgi:glutamyl-tRNA reductase
MFIAVVGLSHAASPVELRERVTYTAEMRAAALEQLRSFCAEAVILDTCNRSEIYVAAGGPSSPAPPRLQSEAASREADEREALAHTLRRFLADFHHLAPAEFEPHLYIHHGRAAAAHLCTVAAGADSQVLGEAQVLAQVREAFEFAAERRACGPILSSLFRQALRAGKRSRTETRIAHGSLSLGSVAVQHVENLLGPLAPHRVLLIGAGKLNALVARSLKSAKVERLSVASRTAEHAEALAAEFGGDVLAFADIAGALAGFDLVFTATAAPHLILPLAVVAAAATNRSRPLCIVDLALPRDVDPLAAGLPGVQLVGLDDLRALAERNLAQRRAELVRVQEIVAEESDEYERWLSTLAVAPTITALHQRAEDIRQSELADHLRRLPDLSPREKRVIESMTAGIIGRLLREPTLRLKSHAHDGEGKPYADALRELFGLDEPRAD